MDSTELNIIKSDKEEIDVVPDEYTIPLEKNLVWDFANATCKPEERCKYMKKKIPASGNKQYLTFSSYFPSVFASIRDLTRVSEELFLDSWKPDLVVSSTPQKGPGKSGSLFVVSPNQHFLLKTLKKEEKDKLCQMAEDLLQLKLRRRIIALTQTLSFKHFEEFRESFLSRIFALLKVTAQGRTTYFCIFNNLFDSDHSPRIKYDLKGAVVNRKSTKKALARDSTVRLDLDDRPLFLISANDKKILIEQLKMDANFLSQHNIMDYSVLIGISDSNNPHSKVEPKKKKSKKKKSRKQTELTETESKAANHIPSDQPMWKTGIVSPPKEDGTVDHYMIGVIDILQDYNRIKKITHFLKIFRYCNPVRPKKFNPIQSTLAFMSDLDLC